LLRPVRRPVLLLFVFVFVRRALPYWSRPSGGLNSGC
jgi:hypothetical protein